MFSIRDIKNLYHQASASLAVVYYGFPSKRLTVIGVTGTDGKTTTTHLIYDILKTAGKKSSMVSSVTAIIAGKQYDTGFHVTTPDSWMLQKFLRQAADAGQQYLVLEVTSHALDQNRVVGIDFAVGVLTNITHEHLDYHQTYQKYLKTKERLLKRAQIAVINKDDESYKYLNKQYLKIVTYAVKNDADFTPKKFPFITPLPGQYNRYNCLAAIAVAKQLDIPDEIIKKTLKTFKGVKGRFEKIPTKFGFEIIIDFAHTPNAIEKVLSTLRPLVQGKIIHVFGSAGLRDYTKRPLMGEMSAKYADKIVLTEEDYRTEDVNQIISEIAQGAIKTGAKELSVKQSVQTPKVRHAVFFRIPQRQEAIDFAIKLARKGDTVILTGKAHEKSLCRGTTEYEWSEHQAVENALKNLP